MRLEEVRKRYSNPLYWAPRDSWHRVTTKRIRQHIFQFLESHPLLPDAVVVNLGSGGEFHGLLIRNHIHLDLTLGRLRGTTKALAASINHIPLAAEIADLAICVGAVLNYTDAQEALGEISRIMKPGAYLLLEFESSRTFELLLSTGFNRDSVTMKTFFNGKEEIIYAHSPDRILTLMALCNLTAIRIRSFHVLSSLFIRIAEERVASLGAIADPLLSRLPGLQSMGANIFIVARKA